MRLHQIIQIMQTTKHEVAALLTSYACQQDTDQAQEQIRAVRKDRQHTNFKNKKGIKTRKKGKKYREKQEAISFPPYLGPFRQRRSAKMRWSEQGE